MMFSQTIDDTTINDKTIKGNKTITNFINFTIEKGSQTKVGSIGTWKGIVEF